MKKVINVEGMSCEHCVAAVTNALEAVDGVKSAKVSLKKKSATVKLDSDVSNDILKKAVDDAGFCATDIN